MSNPVHTYAMADAVKSVELKRLRQIDDYMSPITQARLARLGVAPGWRCVDVGAGAGGVARWLAERVGAAGRVIATDLTPYFQAEESSPQLEVRQHDILEEGLEPGFYDLIHCRLLLVNLSAVELALRHMFDALRPGGWLIVEEPGETQIPAVGEANGRVEAYNRLYERFLVSISAGTNAVDLALYRKLPGLFSSLGVVNIGGEHTQGIVGPEGRAATLSTVEGLRSKLANTLFYRDGEADRLIEIGSDPDLLTVGGATLAMWGQRRRLQS